LKRLSKSFSRISKYIVIAKNTLQEYFVYRTNFFFWRLRTFISFLIFYFLWLAIAHGKTHIGSYTQTQLYTYFVVGYVIRTLVFSTRTSDLGSAITQGSLSRLLLKPLGVFKFFFTRDLIDKIFNIFFLIFEFSLILFLFKPELIKPLPQNVLYFLLSTFLAIISFFLYGFLISLISFWTDTPWSGHWLFGVVFVNLFSGQAIPLDLLPQPVYNILINTPFPYFYYYPMQLFLGKIPEAQVWPLLAKSILLSSFVFIFIKFIWKKGLIRYQSYGN